MTTEWNLSLPLMDISEEYRQLKVYNLQLKLILQFSRAAVQNLLVAATTMLQLLTTSNYWWGTLTGLVPEFELFNGC